jgi:sulfate adenylyltransferase subunit 1
VVAVLNAVGSDNSHAGEGRALRFLLAGSVDDGKSTLTGRLLYECQAILADQLGRLQQKGELDLAMLTDGLEAEREQGITIDVAYRYFSTRRRKFIIADAPGHEQYTRNMVTAASGSDAAIVLVDITKLDLDQRPLKLLPQTRRHTVLAHLLRIPSIIFAVNKIDAVEKQKEAFQAVCESLLHFAEAADIAVQAIVPISALNGDNVTSRGSLDWYKGPTLLELLETLPVEEDTKDGDLLMPVQYVSRDPDDGANLKRVLWGRVSSGSVREGDVVQVFPSNECATVQEVRRAGDTVDGSEAGESAGLILDRHVDVARGSWIATPHTMRSTQRFTAALCWMDTEPAALGRKYWIRHGSRWVQGRIVKIDSCLDIHTLERSSAHGLSVNDIGFVAIETQDALPIDLYSHNRTAGSMIVVDPSTHHTSGALLVTDMSWDTTGADARVEARYDADLEVAYKTSIAGPCKAQVKNISKGGLLVTADAALPIGSRVDVRFDDVYCSARVVDHRAVEGGAYQYHLEFFGLDSAAHHAIDRVISMLSAPG